jgi:NIMA (never in mitosis gene a)-related kinase
MQKFKILEKLGQGAFSKVYKVQRLTDEHEYALKMVKVK